MRIFLRNNIFMVIFLITSGLCVWQVFRMFEKKEIIQQMQTNIQATTQEIKSFVTLNNTANMYKSVSFDAKILHSKAMMLFGRSGKKNGYYVIAPAKLSNQDYALVNLGWTQDKISFQELKDANREITGMIMCRIKKPRFMYVDNDYNKGVLVYLDHEELQETLDLPIKPCIVWQTSPSDYTLIDPQLKIPDNHLLYACTWALLAIISLYYWHKMKRR